MGRLIRPEDVERLAEPGQNILRVAGDAILSPLARDRVRALGLRIERMPAGGPAGAPARAAQAGVPERSVPAGAPHRPSYPTDRRTSNRSPYSDVRSNASDPTGLEQVVRQALIDTLSRLGDADLAQVVRQVVSQVAAEHAAGAHEAADGRPAAGGAVAPDPLGPVGSIGPILTDRVALVTGASSGIGAAVAVAMAEAGARVVVGTFAGDPHPAADTADRIEAIGGECLVVDADVTCSRQLAAACDAAIQRWGRLDIAVANAGVLRRDPIGELTDQRWSDLLDVDLGGVMRTARAAAAGMVDGGSIICVSSIAGGIFGWAEHAHYAAAKAGMLGLARSLAVELGPRGIRVNVVLPGLIETPQSLDPDASLGASGLRSAAGGVPLRRIGTADEVAAAIRFLASDQAGYITGQTLVVDGGISTALPL